MFKARSEGAFGFAGVRGELAITEAEAGEGGFPGGEGGALRNSQEGGWNATGHQARGMIEGAPPPLVKQRE